jgi:hypothetical protein
MGEFLDDTQDRSVASHYHKQIALTSQRGHVQRGFFSCKRSRGLVEQVGGAMSLKLTDHATHDLGGGGFFRMGKETNH